MYLTVKNELIRLRNAYPYSPLRMLNSLAAGADLLCVDMAEEPGVPLIAALPTASEEYRNDFDDRSLKELNYHLARSVPALGLMIRWSCFNTQFMIHNSHFILIKMNNHHQNYNRSRCPVERENTE